MSILEEFVDALEAQERADDLYHSIYFIPEAYQPLEDSYP